MIYHLPKSPPTRPSLPGCCEGRDQSRARGRCGDQEVGGSMLRAVSAAVGNLSVRIALAHLPILHNRKHTNNISEQPNPITSQK